MPWLKRLLPQKRWKRVLICIAAALLLLLAFDLALVHYWRNITISPETTHITAPLQPNGAPDYLLFLNETSMKGVTPHNNAAAPLVLASGLSGTPEYVAAVERILDITAPGEFEGYLSWREKRSLTTLPAGAYLTQSQLAYDFDNAAKTPWAEKDWPEVAAYLQLSEPRLALMHEAARRDRCYFPLLATNGSLNSSTPGPFFARYQHPKFGVMRELVQLLCARAMLNTKRGDYRAAIIDLQASRRIAAYIGDVPDILAWLVAVAMDARTLASARAAILEANIDDQTLQGWADLCTLTPLVPPPALTNLRFGSLDKWCTLARDGWLGIGASTPTIYHLMPVHYNAWLRQVNVYHDDILKSWSLPNVHDAIAAIDRTQITHTQATSSPWPWINVIHKFDAENSFSRWRMLEEQRRLEAQLNLTLIALKRHRFVHGNYPDNLAALVPQFLPVAPADAFARGSPLKYRREANGFILYSVGRDGTDDNGQPLDPNHPKQPYDIVLQSDR